MRKDLINKAVILCGAATLIGSLFLLKGSFLHAQDQKTLTYTSDAAAINEALISDEEVNQEEVMTMNSKRITLVIEEAQNNPIDDLSVEMNGTAYSYNSEDYSDNILSLEIDDSIPQMIELSSSQYYFEPTFLMIEPGNIKDNYTFQAFAGNAPDAVEGAAVFRADGMQKDHYENDEIVTVSIATKNPLHQVFYKIADEPWKKSDGDIFEVHAQSKEAHEVNVSYEVRYYYPQEQEPDIDSFDEPIDPNVISISFLAAKNIEEDKIDDPNPSISDNEEDNTEESTFKDADGNTYTKDEAELKIVEMKEADFNKYQRVIAYFKEYKDIPAHQITYYQAALYVQNTRVQPIENYSMVLPYPSTATAEHEFVIYQFKDGNTDGATLLEYTAEQDGIHITVDNVSAFVVGWKDANLTSNKQYETEDEDQNQVNHPTKNTLDTEKHASVNTSDETKIGFWGCLLAGTFFTLTILNRKKSESHHQ